MKKLLYMSLACLLLSAPGRAQIFYVENFEGGSSSGLSVTSYSGTGGSWTNSVLTTEGDYYNEWYVSCAEQGHVDGVCGDVCGSSSALGSTLHIGSNSGFGGDGGAAYNAGGLCSFGICVNSDRRAESPTINCTGRYGISINFYYIENGDSTNDNASLWVYDGSSWSLLFDMYKTDVCTSGQGQWRHFSYSLPTSCNNNPNVKIGFRWVNDDDGTGTDPSFAVDSVSLSTSGSSTSVTPSFTSSDTVVCQDSCITFISTTTGTVDSTSWSVSGSGVAMTGVHATTMNACFSNAGSYVVKLYAHHGGQTDSVSHSVRVNPAPHPVISASGHVLSTGTGYSSYQWFRNGTAISGATLNSYTYTAGGNFVVVVDSGGCKGSSASGLYNVGVTNVDGNDFSFFLTQNAGIGQLNVNATFVVEQAIKVELFDATGRAIESVNWNVGQSLVQMHTDGLAQGLYIIRLTDGVQSAVLKWMK